MCRSPCYFQYQSDPWLDVLHSDHMLSSRHCYLYNFFFKTISCNSYSQYAQNLFVSTRHFVKFESDIKVHTYFAPATPLSSVGGSRQRYCQCLMIRWWSDYLLNFFYPVNDFHLNFFRLPIKLIKISGVFAARILSSFLLLSMYSGLCVDIMSLSMTVCTSVLWEMCVVCWSD